MKLMNKCKMKPGPLPRQRHGAYAAGTSVTHRSERSCHERLAPLLEEMREYDSLRLKLENSGGTVADFERIAAVLKREIRICGYYQTISMVLSKQISIASALSQAGLYDIHMQVRKLNTGMPVYYLCRTHRDYLSEYSLIVEDVYLSPGYPLVDERFVPLMNFGHETAFLRLSPFRAKIAPGRDALDDAHLSGLVDEILCHVGRHVFQAAWHDDQRPGMQVARHFSLPCFQQTIELLYLCLSGDLCDLRNALDSRMAAFFDTAYPQPAIFSFLGGLAELDGAVINEIPRLALTNYLQLSAEFSRFLNTVVPWGRKRAAMPLYKLIFANFTRLQMVAAGLKDDPSVLSAANALERESRQIVEAVLQTLQTQKIGCAGLT